MDSFDKRNKIKLCHSKKNCPYEQDKSDDAEIEGMPIIPNDPRTCKAFGHICPHFMAAFGFTRKDLKIRAIIHCGETMQHRLDAGLAHRDDPKVKEIWGKYHDILRRFPVSEYPRYYL
jgi:hypothetical protein